METKEYRELLGANKHITLAKQTGFDVSKLSESDKVNKLISVGVNPQTISNIRDHNEEGEARNLAYAKLWNRLQRDNNFGWNAKGTFGLPFAGNTMLSKGELLFGKDGVFKVPKTDMYHLSEPHHILNSYDGARLTGVNPSGTRNGTIAKDLKKESDIAKAKGYIPMHAEGTDDAKVISNYKVNPKEVFEEAKKNIPEMAAGGLVGGIMSLVLGLVGGPLAGAAVGAGASLIKRSGFLKDKLFGKAGENGERDGGIISKTVMDAVKKYWPDMKKFGLAGIIPGLLTPLGPIGGLLAGAAIGFAKNNEKFTNKYFGEEGKLTLKSKDKAIIEKMAPRALKGAGIGAAATLLGGPFGIVGNAAIGAALGILTSSVDFKELFLGKEVDGKREGGILGIVKDAFSPIVRAGLDFKDKLVEVIDRNIVEPLHEFITPFLNSLSHLADGIADRFSTWINNKFSSMIYAPLRDYVLAPIGKTIEKFVTPVAKGVLGAVTSPFKLVGLAGKAIHKSQIKRNTADYETASERIDWGEKHGLDAKQSDKILAAIGTNQEGAMSVEQAKTLRDSLSLITDTEGSLNKGLKTQGTEISKILDSFNVDGKHLPAKAQAKVLKALQQGRMDDVPGILQKYGGLSQENLNSLLHGDNGLHDSMSKYTDLLARKNSFKELDSEGKNKVFADINKAIKGYGFGDEFDISDPRIRKLLMNYLSTEITDREANGNENAKPFEEGFNDLTVDVEELVSTTHNILNLLEEIVLGTNVDLKEKGEKREKDYKKAMEQVTKEYDARSADAERILGTEFYDQLSDEARDRFTAGNMTRGAALDIVASLSGVPSGMVTRAAAKGKASKEAYRIARSGNLSVSDVNNSEGNLRRIEILKGYGPYQFTPKAVALITDSSTTSTKFNQIRKVLRNDYLAQLCSPKYKFTDHDIVFIWRNFHNISTFSHVWKLLLSKKQSMKDFDSLEDAYNRKTKTLQDRLSADAEAAEQNEEEDDEVLVEHRLTAARSIANSFRRGIDNIKRAMHEDEEESEPSPEPEPVEQHGIGTFLLGKAGSLAKNAIGGLLNKGKEKIKPKFNDALFNIATWGFSPEQKASMRSQQAGDLDEVDRPGDGKDIVGIGGGDFIQTRRTSDGSVEPDTSDNKTKTIIDKITKENLLKQKVSEATIKTQEILKKAFDTSDDPASQRGKLNWWKLLLLGGILWKSGILGKVFNGLIKPLWTDHLKPWITDTAVPWITGTLIPTIGNMLTQVLSAAVNLLVKNLPTLIYNGIKGIGVMADLALGNPTNTNATTTVDASKLSGKTGMVDENGKPLTAEDIKNGKYKEIYNAEGAKGTVNEDGTITFKDESSAGSGFLKVAASTAKNAVLHPVSAARAANVLGSLSSTFRAIPSVGRFLTGPYGALGKVADKAGKAGNFIFDTIQKTAENKMIYEAALQANPFAANAAQDAARQSVNKAATKSLKSLDKEISEDAVHTLMNLTGEVVEDSTRAASRGGILAKLLTHAKNAVSKLFASKKFISGLAKVAKFLKIKNAAEFAKTFKNKLAKYITEAIEKAVSKLGPSTTAKLAKGAFKDAVFIASLLFDYSVGWDRAESILGISGDDITVVDKLIAGVTNAISEVTIVLPIIPGTRALARGIYKLIPGISKNYDEKRAKTTSEYEEYVAKTGSTLTEEEYLNRKYSYSGKITGWISDKFNNAKTDVKEFFANPKEGIKKLPGLMYGLTPTGLGSKAGKGIVDFIKGGGAKEALTAVKDLHKMSLMGIGNAAGSWLGDKIKDSPIGGALSVIAEAFQDVLTMPMNLINMGLKKISDFWSYISPNITETLHNIKEWFADKFGWIKDLFENPVDFFKNLVFNGDKLNNSSGGVTASGGTHGVTTFIRPNGEIVTTRTPTSTNTNTGNKTGVLSRIGGAFKSFFSGNKSTASGGFGALYGLGYSKQTDPSISGIRYNARGDTEYQTIGNSGCGPAAAVNALEAMYGMGSRDVINAANFAVDRGYKERDGGTKPGFFRDYFNKHGYGSQTTSSKQQLAANIRSGMPTVLMGRDARGTSTSTPYGRTPHYVTVTGTDDRGRAIVQDPESKYDNQLYDMNDLLNKSQFGVSTYGRGGKQQQMTHLQMAAHAADVVYDEIVTYHCYHRNKRCKTKCFADIKKYKDINCNRSTDLVLQAAGCLPKGKTFGHTSPKDPIRKICGKYSKDKAMKDWRRLKNCYIYKAMRRYKDLPAKYKQKGVAYIYNSDAAVSAGNGYIYSCNASGKHYRSMGMIKQRGGYPHEAIILYCILPNDKIGKSCDPDALSRKGYTVPVDISGSSGGASYDNDDAATTNTFSDETGETAVNPSTALTFTTTKGETKTIGAFLTDTLANSNIGRILSSFTELSSGTTTETSGTDIEGGTTVGEDGFSGSSGDIITGSGDLPKYNLNEKQLKGIANILKHEQPGKSGMMAEASQLANLTDISGDNKATPENLVKKATGGWYRNGYDRYNTGTNDKQAIEAAKQVLVEGKRTLPRYVDEHDYLGDIVSVKTNGSPINKKDVSKYVPHKTIIRNTQGSTYTFYTQPNKDADPFGYTSEKLRKKWGENHYTVDGTTPAASSSGGFGSFVRYGMGPDDTMEQIGSSLVDTLNNSNVGRTLGSILDIGSSSSTTYSDTSMEANNNNDNSTTTSSSNSSSSMSVGSGDGADVIRAAQGELGYKEKGNNRTKFGEWYGMNGQPWCAMFVSWSANQAGIPTNIIPKYASVKDGFARIKKMGATKIDKFSDAKAGDIFFNVNGGSHTGLVEGWDGKKLRTIEGNSGDKVSAREYSPGDSAVDYIYRPNYANKSGKSINLSAVTNDGIDTSDYANTRGSNGMKPISKYGLFKNSLYGRGRSMPPPQTIRVKDANGYFTIETHPEDRMLDLQAKSINNRIRNRYGTGTTDTRFINTIINILYAIADNTDKLNTIVAILNSKLGMKLTAKDISRNTGSETLKAKLQSSLDAAVNNSMTKINSYADSISDFSINTIIQAMNTIASE